MWKQAFLGSMGLCLVLSLLAATRAADEAGSNWPSFRGPMHTGVAPTADPPTTWSESQNVKWKVAIPGRGSGSPIVWGDRIYLQSAVKTDRTADSPPETASTDSAHPFRLVANVEHLLAQAEPTPPTENPSDDGQRGEGRRGRRGRGGRGGFGGGFGRGEAPTNYHQFVVMCLDRDTGKTIWQKLATEAIPHEGHHGTSSFASSTPVTDGKNLYVSFGSRGIYSYDLDGNLRWKKDLGQMTIRNSFGEGSSPALYGDTLVVNWDHEGDSFIVALDANTGNEKWRKPRPEEQTTWNTPLVVDYNGKTQVIVNGMHRARSYDLETGDILWECGGQAQGAVPTPLVHGDLAFCMTGHRGAALYAIPLSSQGDITDTDKVAWKLDQDTPYVPSPLLYDDHLYFLRSNQAILSCYKAPTGEEVYKTERVPDVDMIYASPVGAAGRIYIAGRNGATVVVKHGPDFEALATNQLDEAIDATPALVGNEIIIRGEKSLYCIAEN